MGPMTSRPLDDRGATLACGCQPGGMLPLPLGENRTLQGFLARGWGLRALTRLPVKAGKGMSDRLNRRCKGRWQNPAKATAG